MRAIAVVNQKGGCGKTTTSINLAAFLARQSRRTLVVDMDPQGHATLGLLADSTPLTQTMYDVFMQRAAGHDARLRDVVRTVHENLDIAPSNILLSAIPETTRAVPGREDMLADLLAAVRADYDYVIIDCPPNVGLLTFNALKACSEVIIPIDPSFFSLHGIGKLLETLDVLAKDTGHEIAARALVTLYGGRTQFARDIVEEIHTHLPERYFTTIIRHSVKLAEAASHGLPIAGYCSRCAGFDDYAALTAEVLQMEAPSEAIEAMEAPALRAPGTATPATEQTMSNGHADLGGPSAPRPTPDGVVFALAAPDAQRVQLVGDFNGWTADGSEMEPAGPVWTRVLKLEPGRYRYRYVVDGSWLNDPLNADVEPAPYGGHNSVLVLGERRSE